VLIASKNALKALMEKAQKKTERVNVFQSRRGVSAQDGHRARLSLGSAFIVLIEEGDISTRALWQR
jgi:hypothetical protein